MCWVIRMPGQSGGSLIKNSLIASVPPVDAPTMISFSVDVMVLESAGKTASAERRGVIAEKSLGAAALRTLALAAARILSVISSAYCCMPLGDVHLGFVEKIHRAQFQRTEGNIRAPFGQGRNHHHRHRSQAHQFFQEIEPVHAGHFDVQGEHVRVELLDQFPRHQWIGGCAHHFHVGLAIDDFLHQAADQRRVVDDQNFNFHLTPCMSLWLFDHGTS